jgi:hypothetical protein
MLEDADIQLNPREPSVLQFGEQVFETGLQFTNTDDLDYHERV